LFILIDLSQKDVLEADNGRYILTLHTNQLKLLSQNGPLPSNLPEETSTGRARHPPSRHLLPLRRLPKYKSRHTAQKSLLASAQARKETIEEKNQRIAE
jgi:hypothetical protein